MRHDPEAAASSRRMTPDPVVFSPRPANKHTPRHQSSGRYTPKNDSDPFVFPQELAEGRIVLWLVKHLPASIASVDDVIAQSPDCCPSRAWHGR